MIRLLALISFVYQSASAIVLIFALSHILAPSEYTIFSLALASSQFLSVLMFEWLQLAGVRFLAAARGDDATRLRSSLVAAALLSTIVLISFGGVASLASTLAIRVIGLGLALAVLQGLTDMHFMMTRVSDKLGTASLLMIIRASLLMIGAIAGALFRGTTEATLLGLVSGQAAALAIGWMLHRLPLMRVSAQSILADWADFSRYGMLAAGASVIHLSVPVTIRFIVISGLAAAGPGATAGFSMAIDLLQRPFAVLLAAIHTMNYPEVVIQFEHGSEHDAHDATARLFDFILCATIVMLGGLIGFLPDAARLFVPADFLASFLAATPAAAAFYFFHTHLQSTLAVIPHLRKSALRLVVVAAFQLLAVAAVSAVAVFYAASPPRVLALAALATAVVIVLASGPTIRFGAVPRAGLFGIATVFAIIIGSFSTVASAPLIVLVGKIALAAAATTLIAWYGGFLSRMRKT